MSEQTRQAVLDQAANMLDCARLLGGLTGAVGEGFTDALDAHTARERMEAVAALGCQRAAYETDPCEYIRHIDIDPVGNERETALSEEEYCAPCRAQAEIDEEDAMTEGTGA